MNGTATRKRRSSDTVAVHPLSPLPVSKSMYHIRDKPSDLSQTSRFLVNSPSMPPRKASDSALLKTPIIPPRTSSMPLNNRLTIKKTDESSWATFLKIHKKNKGYQAKSVEPMAYKENIEITENDAISLILEWSYGKYQVTAGRKDALYKRLLIQESEDDFVDVYLMNHTFFISSFQLLKQLIETFYVHRALQARILNIIHRWLSLYFYDFGDKILLGKLNSFLSQEYIFNEQIFQIQSIIQQRRPSLHIQQRPTIYSERSIFFVSSQDLARYLSLVDHSLFDYITSNELIYYGDKEKLEAIELMTQRFNKFNRWVVQELYSTKSFKLRKTLIVKFLEIAKICFELNNFQTSMIITMALSSTCTKLKQSWQALSHKDASSFRLLQKLLNVNANMRYYRSKLKLVKKLPVIPFLPIVLKDLLFLKENASWLEPELINFSKCRCIQQLIEKNRKCTSRQYWFAQDLMFVPFFSNHLKQSGALDSVSDWMEDRLNEIQ